MSKEKIKQGIQCIISLIIILGASLLCLTSCGHNMTTNSKGIGADISWSGDGYIPNVRLGYWDVANTVLRGNTTYTSNTSTGGGGGLTGGTNQTIHIATGPQFNQGNVRDAIVSQNVGDETKKEIFRYLIQAKQPTSQPSTSKTIGAAGSTGSDAKDVDPVTTGIDKVVEKVGDVAESTVPAVKEVAVTSVNAVPQVTEHISEITKYVVIGIVIIAAIIVVVGVLVAIKYLKNKKQNNQTLKKVAEKAAEQINKII